MLKKNYFIFISYFLIFSFIVSPSLVHAIDIYDPTYDPNYDDPGYNMGSVYDGSQSNYNTVADLNKINRDPAAAQSLTSCSKAVPAVQRAVIGLQYAKQDPTRNDTLLTIFNNIPALVGGVKAIDSAYITVSQDTTFGPPTTSTVLNPEAKKQWRNFGSGLANTATFGLSGQSQMKKAESDKDTVRIKELMEQETFRTECLDSIKISIATNLLDRGTNEMVSLIQTGNFGNPMYVADGQQWFRDMQNQTLIDVFGTDLRNRQNGLDMSNPYAFGTIRSIINSSQDRTFQEKSIYTLGDVLVRIQNRYGTGNGVNNIVPDAQAKRNAVNAFRNDFTAGGWEAWNALIQNPANNPIGYAILAQEELSNQEFINQRSLDAENNPQLLSKKVCVAYYDADNKVIERKNTKIDPSDKTKCARSEVVTPGSLITERMKWFLTSDIRQLELANKFNSSISTILTASINKATQLGLDKIQTRLSNNWSSTGLNSSLAQYAANRQNFMSGQSKTSVRYQNKNYELFLNTNSGYWKQNLDLDRDLNDVQVGCEVKKGLYTNQKEYVEELEYMVNNSTSPLPKIVPYVALLDMCVPGPTPVWQDISDENFAAFIDAVGSQDPQNLGSPDLSFTEIKEIMERREKTSGALNTIGSITSSVGPVLPPPANGIAMIVGAGLNISSAIVRNSRINGLTPQDYSSAINTFGQYTEMVLSDEALKNQTTEVNKTINAYESMVDYLYETYSDQNNLPVAVKARPVIGDLVEKNANINATMQAYRSEYQNASIILKELESIKRESDAIHNAVRARMSAKYDIKDANGIVIQKWDQVPAVCTQSCSVVKPPIERPKFDSVDALLRGMKLQNGVWTTGNSLKDILTGTIVSKDQTNDQSLDKDFFKNLTSTNNLNNTSNSINSSSNLGDPNFLNLNNNTLINYPVINYFSASDALINRGDTTDLSWDVKDSTSVIIKGPNGETIKTSSSVKDTIYVSPTTTTTYTIVAKNSRGESQENFTITVVR